MDTEGQAIVDLLVRYARSVDTKDWELLRTCFIEDAAVDYGDFGAWQGLEDFTTFMVVAHAGMGRTQHSLSNFQVDVIGERATSVTYVHAVTVLASNPDDWIDTIGIYEDDIARGEGGWRIAKRTLRTTRTVLSPSLSTDPRQVNEPGAPS